jgi:hypothetical protein
LESFERSRAEGADFRDLVGGAGGVLVGEHDQRASGREIDETHGCAQRQRAGALRADEGARDVKAFLGEQVVEIVT